MDIKKEKHFDNSDKRYTLLVFMGIVALIATFLVVVYYLKIEMNNLRTGDLSVPDTSVDMQLSPSPDISASP